MKSVLPVFLLGCFLILSACNDNNSNTEFSSSSDTALHKVVAKQGLTGGPATDRELPDINDPMAQLGMKLFFTKGLGGDQDSACVTCHLPMLGGGDNLSLSIVSEAQNRDLLGPGRTLKFRRFVRWQSHGTA